MLNLKFKVMDSSVATAEVYQLSCGKIESSLENGIEVLKSIRYANSTRFQKPEAVADSEDWINLPSKTPVAPQNTFEFLDRMIQKTEAENFLVEENNQFLSIYKPMGLQNEKLPILVWIHGGSYEIGCGDIPTSDPSSWVKEQNIIVVAVSYRLGYFGFLGGTEERPANLGLLDMLEALKWIQKNADNFGGDSSNVTMLGQSSGGDAIAHLMLVKDSEKLFKRAIIQSAPLGLRLNREKMVAQFLNKTRKYSSVKNGEEVIKFEVKKRPSVLKYGLKAAMPYGTQYGHFPLCSEKESWDLWKKKAPYFDVLIGYNEDETAFYIKTQPKLRSYSNRDFGKRMLDKAVRWSTDKIYAFPTERFAKNWKSGGGNCHLFKLKSTIENHTIGAGHCFDLPLLFGNKNVWEGAGILNDLTWNFVEENGIKLRAIWVGFIKNGIIGEKSNFPEVLEIE